MVPIKRKQFYIYIHSMRKSGKWNPRVPSATRLIASLPIRLTVLLPSRSPKNNTPSSTYLVPAPGVQIPVFELKSCQSRFLPLFQRKYIRITWPPGGEILEFWAPLPILQGEKWNKKLENGPFNPILAFEDIYAQKLRVSTENPWNMGWFLQQIKTAFRWGLRIGNTSSNFEAVTEMWWITIERRD